MHQRTMTRTGGKKGNGAKKGEDKVASAKKFCFPDCKNKYKHTDSMVQCHLCQRWAHYQCIDEEETAIIGL